MAFVIVQGVQVSNSTFERGRGISPVQSSWFKFPFQGIWGM